MEKVLKQSHNLEVFIPLDPAKITAEEKKRAIASLMLLIEKRWDSQSKVMYRCEEANAIYKLRGRSFINSDYRGNFPYNCDRGKGKMIYRDHLLARCLL